VSANITPPGGNPSGNIPKPPFDTKSSPASPSEPPTKSARDAVNPSSDTENKNPDRPADPQSPRKPSGGSKPANDGPSNPEEDSSSNPPREKGSSGDKKDSEKANKKDNKNSSPRTSREAVGETKADRQRQRAASAGRTIAAGAGGTADDQELAGSLGASLADMKNAETAGGKGKAAMDAAEKGARLVANKKTGGASEKVLKTAPGRVALKVTRVAAVASMLLPLVLVGALILSAVVVVTAVTGVLSNNSGIEYKLDSTNALAIEDEYLLAYQQAGRKHDVPWTLLAGIGQVATEQGRYAPSDVADYGLLVDRAPFKAPIGSLARSSSTSGKYSPPSGSSVTVIGDSFAADRAVMNDTADMLPQYSVSFDGTVGAKIDVVAEKAPAALAKSQYVVVQVGVNDMAGDKKEAIYRKEIQSLLDSLSSAKCVVWVNLQVFYGKDYSYIGPRAQRFNTVLAEEVATRPWTSVADLATATAAVGMRGQDGLHLSPTGARAWADVVTRTLSTCLSARTAGPPAPSNPTVTSTPPTTAAASPTSTTTPSATPRLTASGQPVKVDASYGTYVCEEGICGPYPRIGTSKGTPLGPLQLKPEFVKKYAFGRSPDDIKDSADMLAEELDRLRDAALAGESAEFFAGWKDSAPTARQLWGFVLSQAPVVLPSFASTSSCEQGPLAGTQGSAYAWPVADPVSLGEFGAAADASGSVQVAGMTLSGSGPTVLASGQGTVADVGTSTDGPYVVLDHGDGFSTRYSRLSSTKVLVGAKLEAGAVLGNFNGSFLFQTSVGASPRNPRLYIADSSSVAIAEEVSLDPQGSSAPADAQSGTSIDPCTGLRIVSTLSSTSTASTSATFAGLPTPLVMPAAGILPSQLQDSFGDPRDGGARRHQGIDIIIPVGVPLIAVTDAVVHNDSAGGQICSKTGLPGKGVTLKDSLGNHYYYGHMDTVAVQEGQIVTAGAFIGTSGATGNACTSVPHLHFSINENKSNVVNPFPVLSGARPLKITDFASNLVGGELTRLTGSSTLNGAADYVLSFASFYGGIIPSDPDAGIFPGNPSGFQGSSGAAGSGESGEALAQKFPEIAAIIKLYFPPAQWDNAIRIANCESGMNPNAIGENKDKTGKVLSRDYGLFQFNDQVTLQGWLTRTGEDPQNFRKALDPHWSARAAALKVAADGNWGQWSCAHTPYGEITRGLSIVSSAPKEIATNGKTYDYFWQESGVGDTSVNYRPPAG
jgi:murein DD-endopeptidase MepM/ murein hydrolase activator NlpD